MHTPDGVRLDQRVRALRFPGSDGQLGVLPRHAPMMARVSCGLIHVAALDGPRERFAVGEGFAEVNPTCTDLMVDFLNGPGDVDVGRAHGALQRADDRLRRRDGTIDVARAEAALCRAIARLKICGCGCSLCREHC